MIANVGPRFVRRLCNHFDITLAEEVVQKLPAIVICLGAIKQNFNSFSVGLVLGIGLGLGKGQF